MRSPWEGDRLRELSVGQRVYVGETPIGTVEKLLVDPGTWRITALVVRTTGQDAPAGQPWAPGAVVVPVDHVERVTLGEVYLNVREGEIARLPRFDSLRYPTPDRDWPPPGPFRREDLALDLSHNLAAPHASM